MTGARWRNSSTGVIHAKCLVTFYLQDADLDHMMLLSDTVHK